MSYTTSKTDKTDSDVINSVFTDPVQELYNTLSEEEINAVLMEMFDDGGILPAIKTAVTIDFESKISKDTSELGVTDFSALVTAIETVTGFEVESQSVVDSALEEINEQLGCVPCDVTVTDPDVDTLNPMVSIDQDSVHLVDSRVINSRLLLYAFYLRPRELDSNIKRKRKWCDALGLRTVTEFKKTCDDPNALGFIIEKHIPATGLESEATALTELPHVGDVTAKQTHPLNNVMSIEDIHELSDMQARHIEFPISDIKDSRTPEIIASVFTMLDTDVAVDVCRKLYGFDDVSSDDNSVLYMDSSKMLGITVAAPSAVIDADTQTYDSHETINGEHEYESVSTITRVQFSQDAESVNVRKGYWDKDTPDITKDVDAELWRIIDELRTVSGVTVKTHKDTDSESSTPIVAELPNEQCFLIASLN